MWTVSAFQMHPKTTFVCDEDATLELRVKTVKYFKGLMEIHNQLVIDWFTSQRHSLGHSLVNNYKNWNSSFSSSFIVTYKPFYSFFYSWNRIYKLVIYYMYIHTNSDISKFKVRKILAEFCITCSFLVLAIGFTCIILYIVMFIHLSELSIHLKSIHPLCKLSIHSKCIHPSYNNFSIEIHGFHYHTSNIFNGHFILFSH